MSYERRPLIYDFEDKALDIADEYRFVLRMPVAFRSPEYREYFEQKTGENSLESLAETWLEAEEKVETRASIIKNRDTVESRILTDSSLEMLKKFYSTANTYMEAENRFSEAFENELQGYTSFSEVMEARGVDFPKETLDTLEKVEEAREVYVENHGYDFLKGY